MHVIAFQSSDCLGATPVTLSHGCQAETEFCIGYQRQSEAAHTPTVTMCETGRKHMTAFFGAAKIVRVAFDFVRAAASLDVEISVDVCGSAAGGRPVLRGCAASVGPPTNHGPAQM